MAGIVGLEPTALELTVIYSTIELYANFWGAASINLLWAISLNTLHHEKVAYLARRAGSRNRTRKASLQN